jgi:toxin ParE1/3/4
LAVRDVGQIWAYIASDNVSAADRLLESIDSAIQRLANNPEQGSPAFELRPGLRCQSVRRRYLIYYVTTAQELQIMRILHGARDHDQIISEH